MESSSMEAPVMELTTTGRPTMVSAAEVRMQRNDDSALRNEDSPADLLQQERGEGNPCIDHPKNVELIVSSSPRVDASEITLGAPDVSEASLESLRPVTCVTAVRATEEFPVTAEITLEQRISLSQKINEGAQESEGLGKQLCEEDKSNRENKIFDASEALHQGNASTACEEETDTLPESGNLGSSSSENKKYDGNDVDASALSLEIVDEGGNGKDAAALALEILDEELRPRSSETENLDKNAEFPVRDDNPGRNNQEDECKVVHEVVKDVHDDSLEVSQDCSNGLDSRSAETSETRKTLLTLETVFSPSQKSASSPDIVGFVPDDGSKCIDNKSREGEPREHVRTSEAYVQNDKNGCSLVASASTCSSDASNVSSGEKSGSGTESKASNDESANTVRVMEGSKLVCEQGLVVAKTSAGEVCESLSKLNSSILETAETEVDVGKKGIGTVMGQTLKKQFNTSLGAVFTSKGSEMPIVGIHDDEVLEYQERGMDFHQAIVNESSGACALKEFQESEGDTVIGETSFSTAKQATIVGQEDDPAVECCKAGNLLAQTGNDAASSEEQCQQEYSHDKDGGSSMDSTAGSGWKLCGTEGQVALEDGDNSGSEDSASSRAGIQPQLRKKRIDLQHQFVREIVKIQHDREQYDRELFERQIQAQRQASLAQQGAKAVEIQKSSLVGKRQLRNDLGKNFMHRRQSEGGGPDRHVKDSQQTLSISSKNVTPVHAKGVSLQFKGGVHEGNGAEYSSEGNQQGKIGQNKYNRFMPIYRPPNVRDSFPLGSDEKTSTVESDFPRSQSATFIVSSSPDSSTSSVSESCIPSKGPAKREKEKGTLTIVKSSSGERYVHYAGSQSENVEGMGIKVTFDTENHQRHIELSEVDPPRQQKLVERGNPSSFDHGYGFESHLGFDFRKTADGTPFSHSSQASFSSSFGSSPPVAHGKGTSSEMLSSAKSKHSQRARGLPSRTTMPMRLDAMSPPISQPKKDATSLNQFQPALDRGRHGSFEGKHRVSEQLETPVITEYSSLWFQESPLIPVPFGSNSATNIHGGKLRHVEERTSGVVNSYSRNSGTAIFSNDVFLEGFANDFSHRKFSTGGWAGDSPGKQSFRVPQPSVSSSEMTHTEVNGELDMNASDRGKEKRVSKTKDYRSSHSIKIENLNPSLSTVSSHSGQASGTSQVGLDTKGEKQDKIQGCADSQVNLQESLVCENSSRAENSDKGSTLILQPNLSSSSVEEHSLHSTRLLGKWGDIVDDSPDGYDDLQMKAEVGMVGFAAGSQSVVHPYKYNSPRNSDSTDVASSIIEKPLSKDFSKGRGLKKNALSDRDKHKNKVRVEVVQNSLVHSANEVPARKSVFQRLGPQNFFGGSILGRPPQVLDEKDVVRAIPNTFSSGTFDFSSNRNFEVGYHGSAQAFRGAHLPSVLHDDHYDAESGANIYDEGTEVVVQAYKDLKQKRSKRELYVPRRGL